MKSQEVLQKKITGTTRFPRTREFASMAVT